MHRAVIFVIAQLSCVEYPGKSQFSEIEKTRMKVSKVLQPVTSVVSVKFLRNIFVHTTCTGNKTVNFNIAECCINSKYFIF